MKLLSRKTFHTIFEAGVWIKAIDSAVEITIGTLFYFLNTATVNHIIVSLFGDELIESQRDPIWNFFFHNFKGITLGGQHLWAFLLIGHGILKMLLLAGLLKRKTWIYPASGVAFSCLAVYQIIVITSSPDIFLVTLTIFDLIFIGLIFHEYAYQTQKIG